MNSFILAIYLVSAVGEVGGKGNNTKDDKLTKVYIRLKDPVLSYAGRVEISKDEKTWGTICDKYWTGNDANVTCIQLGFPFAVAAVPMAGFSAGTGSIFLKDVQCTGSEKSLVECEHDVWKTHDVNESCNHSMDVGVVCYPHKEILPMIIMIVLGSFLGLSCLVNICLIYYVCCKRKRKKKRHLTAVKQSTLSRRTGSQARLDNLGIDNEICTELSTSITQNNLIIQKNGNSPADPSTGKSTKEISEEATANQGGMEQHVYQRLQSCVIDPVSEEYRDIFAHGLEKPLSQQAERKEIGKSVRAVGYQSIKPKGVEHSKDDGNGKVNRYEHLQLQDRLPHEVRPSQVEQGSDPNGNESEDNADYVDVVDDGRLATNAKAIPTSSGTKGTNLYETLRSVPGSPSHQVNAAGPCSTSAADQHSVQVENQEEDDYMELLA
ncbi:uncharacterized protein LOC111329238 [Stylophora pistillata]|uniref:uncharacterized protein LOC111329238 n=1 Tax=Stylophora pistillata TaxID=50429 RepID=UPI000C052D01|nr:uncharacterized protein LOC111329238 [Stylophora pistillata]